MCQITLNSCELRLFLPGRCAAGISDRNIPRLSIRDQILSLPPEYGVCVAVARQSFMLSVSNYSRRRVLFIQLIHVDEAEKPHYALYVNIQFRLPASYRQPGNALLGVKRRNIRCTFESSARESKSMDTSLTGFAARWSTSGRSLRLSSLS